MGAPKPRPLHSLLVPALVMTTPCHGGLELCTDNATLRLVVHDNGGEEFFLSLKRLGRVLCARRSRRRTDPPPWVVKSIWCQEPRAPTSTELVNLSFTPSGPVWPLRLVRARPPVGGDAGMNDDGFGSNNHVADYYGFHPMDYAEHEWNPNSCTWDVGWTQPWEAGPGEGTNH